MSSENCVCTLRHPTSDGRCANPSLAAESPEDLTLSRYSSCACCMADCPDVHPEPDSGSS